MRIELSEVRKRFGEVEALRGVSLSLPEGARVALVGPNGSGKSTLIRVLTGILSAEGRVTVDGLHPMHDRAAIAPRMAYAPQVAPHLEAPVREVVLAIATVRDISVDAVRAVGRRLDLDLAEVEDRPFRGLSGGTKQKLLLSLALSAHASFVILDEPTASLDARARARFFQLFSDLPPETTLLLCSHRIEEMRQLVDRVIALDEGRVVYDGPASAYLDANVVSVLQLFVTDPEPRGWLLSEGFEEGRDGWWTKTVSPAERIALLPKVTRELGTRLRDVLVRERLDAGLDDRGADD